MKELVGKNKKLIFGRDAVGRSPLHLAGKAGHVELIKFFLNEDAETTKLFDNVNALGSRYRYSTDDNKTPLGDSLSVQNLSVHVLVTSPCTKVLIGIYRYRYLRLHVLITRPRVPITRPPWVIYYHFKIYPYMYR